MLECLEPDIDQLFLHRERRHIRTPTFAPVSDRRNVYAVQIRIPVITFAGFGNQLAPIFQVQRIAEIRLPDFSVLVGIFVGAFRSGLPEPFRQRILDWSTASGEWPAFAHAPALPQSPNQQSSN